MDACCLCSVERACSPCRLVEVSQLVPIVTDEMMMEIYTSAQIHYLSEQGWLQGCVAMHGHTLRHLCFVSSFIVLNRGGRARNVVVVPSRRTCRSASSSVVHHHLSVRRFVTDDVACLRQLETHGMSLRTKLVYFDIVPCGTSIALDLPSSLEDTREAQTFGP
jgi:hypothetical protein